MADLLKEETQENFREFIFFHSMLILFKKKNAQMFTIQFTYKTKKKKIVVTNDTISTR